MNQELTNKIEKLRNDTTATYLSSRRLYEGKFIQLVEEEYLLPNGVIMKRERIIKNHGKQSVIIIAITNDNKYLLVSQNRINKTVTLEFPSGYVEDGESIIVASTRELLEETGYYSCDVRILDSYYNSIGIDSSIVNIVIAYNAVKVKEQNLGKYEYINYDEFSFDELKELVEENYIGGVGNKLAFYELLNSKSVNTKKLTKSK